MTLDFDTEDFEHEANEPPGPPVKLTPEEQVVVDPGRDAEPEPTKPDDDG